MIQLAVMVVHVGKNANPPVLPPFLGYGLLGIGIAIIVLCLAVGYAQRNDPVPILKRTKNPHRRYKVVGYRRRK